MVSVTSAMERARSRRDAWLETSTSGREMLVFVGRRCTSLGTVGQRKCVGSVSARRSQWWARPSSSLDGAGVEPGFEGTSAAARADGCPDLRYPRPGSSWGGRATCRSGACWLARGPAAASSWSGSIKRRSAGRRVACRSAERNAEARAEAVRDPTGVDHVRRRCERRRTPTVAPRGDASRRLPASSLRRRQDGRRSRRVWLDAYDLSGADSPRESMRAAAVGVTDAGVSGSAGSFAA
jgi:hypothetical protein